MKIYPNLAGGLRFYFGLARALALVFAAFWFLALTFSPVFKQFVGQDTKLMVSVGEAVLPSDSIGASLASDTAKTGSLAVVGLRGLLRADLLSEDSALVTALRWTIYPCVAVFAAFAWMLFGSLRDVCVNIGRGEAFSEGNLRVMKRIGLVFITFSLVGLGMQFWAAHAMGGYLSQHVVLAGLKSGGPVHFSLPGGLFPLEGGLVIGFMVLLLTEAFHQGLNLKTENDLTV